MAAPETNLMPPVANDEANVQRDNKLNERLDKFWRIALEGRQYHDQAGAV